MDSMKSVGWQPTCSHFRVMPRCLLQFALLTILSTALFAGQDSVPLTAEAVLTKLAAMESARNKRLPSYKVIREYHLELESRGKSVISTAEIEYRQHNGKTYRILNEEGADGLFRRALHKVMQAEVKTVQSESEVEVGPKNYSATILGKEIKDGRECYLLSIVPKRNSKFLLKGKAWIDIGEFGLVRMEGYPTESLSFWVGKPYIVQTFENVGGHFLMRSNKSLVEAKIVGHLELTISSKNYTLKPGEPVQRTAELSKFEKSK